MKLGIRVIYSELCQIFGTLKEPFLSQELQKSSLKSMPHFGVPFYHKDAVTLEDGQLYVVHPSQVPEDLQHNGQCLLIIPECPERFLNRKGISVITVSGVGIDDLFNAVISIFEKYSDWDYSLKELVFSNAPIEDYLKIGFKMLGNSMNVHNSNYNIIAQYKASYSSAKLSHTLNPSLFDPDFLIHVDRAVDESVFYSRKVILYKDPQSREEFLFLNLFAGNTVIGRLVIYNDSRRFLPQDMQLASHLGKYLETSLSYISYSGSGKNLRRDSLLEYLSGKNHSDEKIIHLKTISPLSKLHEDQHLFILVCDSQNIELSDKYVALQIERFIPDSVCVTFADRLVLMCSNMHGQSTDELFDALSELFAKYTLIAGCSNPFEDFENMMYCYQEALFTLNRIESLQNPQPINYFRDHTLEHILKYGTSIIPAHLLCAGCIMDLAKRDKDAQVSYCDSLRIYLDCGMNMMETARLLNIKRNTFLARLERIMRFIDLDLDDADDRLYLQISLRMIRHS